MPQKCKDDFHQNKDCPKDYIEADCVASDNMVSYPCSKNFTIAIKGDEENVVYDSVEFIKGKKGFRVDEVHITDYWNKNVYTIKLFYYNLSQTGYRYFWFTIDDASVLFFAKHMFNITRIPKTNIYIADINPHQYDETVYKYKF